MDGEQATLDYEKNQLFNIVENHVRIIEIVGANWRYISFSITHSICIDLCKSIYKKKLTFAPKQAIKQFHHHKNWAHEHLCFM
jgi:hypothetical protein